MLGGGDGGDGAGVAVTTVAAAVGNALGDVWGCDAEEGEGSGASGDAVPAAAGATVFASVELGTGDATSFKLSVSG